METEFNDDPLFALEKIHRQSKEMTATNEADIVIAMFKKTPDYPVDFCGAVNFFDLSVTLDIGVIVANCGYDTYTVAHEFGHALGIDHSRDIPSEALPFIESAHGYVDPVTGYGSVMSYQENMLPLFSSPNALFTVDGQQLALRGEDANAVSAANEVVFWVSISNEFVHRDPEASGLSLAVQEDLTNAWSVGGRPEPVSIYD